MPAARNVTTIARPVGEVFAFVADGERLMGGAVQKTMDSEVRTIESIEGQLRR